MKEKILRMLRRDPEGFLSGQRLCEELGVSRQTVWKNINSLKELGYEIESVTNKGYRLTGVPDRLLGEDIISRMPEDCLCNKVACYDSLESTNTKAKQLAEAGEPEGTLVVAEEQTAGRGRRGRGWVSEPGIGIWMSLILRPKELMPIQASGLTLMSALAVAKGIRSVCSLPIQIKWPNDIILDGKKLCGILTETSSEPDCVHYAVVGIGINVNTEQFPEELRDHVTSLYLQTKEKVDRQALIAAIMTAMTDYYQCYRRTGDLSLLLEEYNELLVNRDEQVRIYYGLIEDASPEDIKTGIARGIDAEGALLVDTENGEERVVSGEVSVRGIYGYA